MTEADYQALKPETVHATKAVGPDGEVRYALDDIVGTIHGIGVENLRGSGMIAGETSRAYDETFTLSFVTGRSVGIGAYLVRLGKRVIQMVDGPMILTGYSALNKLLGKDVYTSQDQLGGPQVRSHYKPLSKSSMHGLRSVQHIPIAMRLLVFLSSLTHNIQHSITKSNVVMHFFQVMVPNGVTHEVVPNDQEGVNSMLDWLSYVPKDINSPPPQLAPVDPIERDVEFMPTKTPYDPR